MGVLFDIPVKELKVHRNQRRLPVVAMDDAGTPVKAGNGFQDSPGKKAEPFAVIVEPVKPLTLKVILVVKKIIGNSLPDQFEEAAVLVAPAYGNVEVGNVPKLSLPFLPHVAVEGQDNPYIGPPLPHGKGEASDHIPKFAGSEKRVGLAGGK
jgi:hypothetical protein